MTISTKLICGVPVEGRECPGEGNFYPFYEKTGTRFCVPIVSTPAQEREVMKAIRQYGQFRRTLSAIGGV